MTLKQVWSKKKNPSVFIEVETNNLGKDQKQKMLNL